MKGKAPRQPAEQARAELIFQQLDMVADGGLGDAQLERGARDVEVPRGRLEAAQGIERQSRSFHEKALVHFMALPNFDRL